MNNTILIAAQKWLTELNIGTYATSSTIKVSRDDMVNVIGCDDEEKAYAEILLSLKVALNNQRLYWTGKDDNNLWLEIL